jgi:Fe2+ transport system protein FeoA
MLLDEQARKRLESLGYVSGKVAEEFRFDESKKDPIRRPIRYSNLT